jgi:hypothetical protein
MNTIRWIDIDKHYNPTSLCSQLPIANVIEQPYRINAMKEHISSFHYAEILEQRFDNGVLSELTDYPNFVLWKAVPVQGKIKNFP